MPYRIYRAVCCTTIILAMAAAGGCGGTTAEGFKKIKYGGILPGASKPFDIVVKLDQESWRRAYGNVLPSLEVDLVGINDGEKPTWENYPIGKYFSPNDRWRRDADRVTKTFTTNDRGDKTFSRYNPIWSKWIGRPAVSLSGAQGKGVKWLFVIANIPGIGEDMPGGQDPRRIILPLKGSSWPFRTKKIEIVIKSSMAVCTTPTKADN